MWKMFLYSLILLTMLAEKSLAVGGNVNTTIDCPRTINMTRGTTYSAIFTNLIGYYHPAGKIVSVTASYQITNPSVERPVEVRIFNDYASATMGYVSTTFGTQFDGIYIRPFMLSPPADSFGISFKYSTQILSPLYIPPNTCKATINVSWDYTPPPPIVGDFNGDNIVDLRDVILALNVSTGKQITVTTNGDTDGDGKITLIDAIKTMQAIAGQ